MKNATSAQFWVTNISNRNVTLSDLAVTIPAFRSVNLMDTKHYQYTLMQLKKSAESGSLFKKRNILCVRQNTLDIPSGKYIDIIAIDNPIAINFKESIPSRERSVLVIKEEKYEELAISDEEFASENSEMAELDLQKPIVLTKG